MWYSGSEETPDMQGCWKSCLFYACLLVALHGIYTVAPAQHRTEDPVAMGMGATGTARAGGAAALHINPANLIEPAKDLRNTLFFFQGSTAIGGGLLNISTYNSYLTRGELLDTERQRTMLDQWYGSRNPRRMQHATLNAGMVLAAGTTQLSPEHAAGFSVRLRNYASLGLSRGAAELALGGLNEEIFGEARDANLMFRSFSFMELAAGFAMLVHQDEAFALTGLPWRITAGMSPRLLLGFSQSEFMFNSRVRVNGDDVLHEFSYFFRTQGSVSNQMFRYLDARMSEDTAPSLRNYLEVPGEIGKIDGYGLGVNLGLTASFELDSGLADFDFLGDGERSLRLSVALTDIGSIGFSRNAAVFRNNRDFQWEGFALDRDRIDDEFDGDLEAYFRHVLRDSIARDVYLDMQGSSVRQHRVYLPAAWALGAELRAGRMAVAADLGAGFSGRGFNRRRLALGMGSSYFITQRLPLRLGWYSGGAYRSSWTFGTGFHGLSYRFDIGLMLSPGTKNGGAWAALGIGALQFNF